jgi:hypothetical protein
MEPGESRAVRELSGKVDAMHLLTLERRKAIPGTTSLVLYVLWMRSGPYNMTLLIDNY